MKQPFINEAFSVAIEKYREGKNEPMGITYNSFLSMFIRMLVEIYSELDIINPLLTENPNALIENLTKFGYSREAVTNLFTELELFYEIDIENENRDIKQDNPYFISIQKSLIDMIIKKKINYNLTDAEASRFYELLYTRDVKDPLRLSYNYLTSKNMDEVANYYRYNLENNHKVVEVEPKKLLNLRAYEIFGYTLEQINLMSKKEIDKLNHKIYDYFKIRENAINGEYLLEMAILKYDRENNRLTSGNGYVDILLLMSFICTIIFIVTLLVYR